MTTSIEKLEALRENFLATRPSGEITDTMLRQALRSFYPHLRGLLPEEPAELDDRLVQLAELLLTLRSDDAAPASVVVRVLDA